ncbi:MAG: CerR family C-terminal domain-containing protein [Opitutales bacterium]|nr:CerR family C-terminal domain-containing protein [Opitutales bacterium]
MVLKGEECKDINFDVAENSHDTRSIIALAAIDEFALRSVDGARTRHIAKKANVNHAAISYYFGGKWNMYLEIIRVLVRHFSKLFAPVYEECEAFFKSESKSRAQAIGLLKKYLVTSHQFYLKDLSSKIDMIIKREENFPTEAFDIVFEEGIRYHFSIMKDLIAFLMPDASDEEISSISISIIGMNSSITSCKTAFLKLNGKDSLSVGDIGLFSKTIENLIDKIFQ